MTSDPGYDDNADLILKSGGLSERTAALFSQIERDEALCEMFIRNPVGVLSSHVAGRHLSEQQASDANRLLLSVLSNSEFLRWLEDYPTARDARPVTQDEFRQDFARALVQFGDPVLADAALLNVANGFDIGGPVAQQFVTGSDKSVFTSPATHSTNDQSSKSSQNFNGASFGDNSAIDPALFRSLVEQLLDRARQARAAGELADTQNVIG